MPLIKCRECNRSLSTLATTCPGCGAPAEQESGYSGVNLRFVGLAVLGLLVLSYFTSPESGQDAPAPVAVETDPVKLQALARMQEDKRRSDLKLTAVVYGALALRDAAHDKGSFALVYATAMSDGTGCYKFRARNGFNSLRLEHGVLTPDGKIISSGSTGNRFHPAWAKSCAGQSGTDVTDITNQKMR